jgi:glycine cleavage system aminomethyltransferase T
MLPERKWPADCGALGADDQAAGSVLDSDVLVSDGRTLQKDGESAHPRRRRLLSQRRRGKKDEERPDTIESRHSPESYQVFSDSYRALKETAAIGSVAPRRAIGISGKDRSAFLQGLLTNDIPALTPGTGCYSAWLTPQGRMLTDMHIFESGDMILMDVPAELAEATLQRLDQFLFSEDVQFADLSAALTSVSVTGPRPRQCWKR